MVHGEALLKFQDPEAIYTIASRGKTYVEIGTRWGGSAIVAGLAGCEVHCIDPWEYPGKQLAYRTTPHHVRENWVYAGLDPDKLFLYQQRHPPWPEAIKDRVFDVGMIDGAHEREQVQLDWEGMKSHVSKYVLFHDISKNVVNKVFLEAEWDALELPFKSQFGVLYAPSS
jgi:hypothetical protein